MTDPAPPRRHSPAVYRRRRLAVLLALVAVVAVIGILLWQPWRGMDNAADTGPTMSPSATPTATATTQTTPAATESAAPSETADPEQTVAAVLECTAASVTVEAVTDKETYAVGENPQLSISVTNTSGQPCTMNVGTSTQAFTVSSGTDVWWRSTDCQTEPTEQIVTLEAGQTVQSVEPLEWDRTRSSVSTCGETDRPVASGGGSSFHLEVAIGGVESAATRQFFLY